jgi:hypothetical protein
MKSPLSFSCEPLRIEVQPQEYSMSTQSLIGESSGALTITMNGTQTFDRNGRPWDAVND